MKTQKVKAKTKAKKPKEHKPHKLHPAVCTKCWGHGVSLTTHCLGKSPPEDYLAFVALGRLDYKDGMWEKKGNLHIDHTAAQ